MFELNTSTLLVLIPAAPLIAALLAIALPLVARPLRDVAHWPVVIALALSCLASFRLLGQVLGAQADPALAGQPYEFVTTLWTWVNIPDAYQLGGQRVDFVIDVALRADALTAMMLCMVTFIATLVAIYASGYMEHDPGYGRFFAYFGLFVFSMTMLVSVSNFLLLFVFWEAVGLCSYLLIGFWFQKPEAADAGKKAFLVNRIGDFGFTLAIFLIWTTYGTFNFHDTPAPGPAVAEAAAPAAAGAKPIAGVLGQQRLRAAQAATSRPESPGVAQSGLPLGYVGGGVGLAICLLLMLGACGKSAQFPLHIWLPDAMEGPTPVSALIHAATMVTAGVYMVTRCTPLFMVSPEAQLVVATIGGFTAILAGLIALTQFDLKRVLAYSTVSQLGYMFLALGTGLAGGITAGMFHILTHAFFKALLFLGAGSVMHAMGGVIDMRRFGGLRGLMPWTCGTFLIGSLALAGVFPLSGFWSKDAVLAAVHDKAHDYAHAYDHVAGVPHSAAEAAHGGAADHGAAAALAAQRESLLAGLTPGQLLWYGRIYQGLYWLGLFTAMLTAFYTFRAFFMTFYGEEKIPHEAGHHAHESPPVMTVPLVILAVCAVVAGLVLSPFFGEFLQRTPSLGAGPAVLTHAPAAFHFDVALFSTIAAGLGIGAAAYLYLGHTREVEWLRGCFDLEGLRKAGAGAWILSPYQLSLNKFYFDEIYQVLFVLPAMILAQICYWLDRYLVDGLVNLIGTLPPAAGQATRRTQTGLVPWYALAMALGLVVLLVARGLGAI